MKNFIICLVLAAGIFSVFSGTELSASDNQIPVIAIEPMLDRIGWYMSHKAYTFQTRLSAELFTRYQCHISARNKICMLILIL